MLAAGLNFVLGAHTALISAFLLRDLHVPVALVGVFMAIDGVGAVLGAALATPVIRRFGSGRVTSVGAWLVALGSIVMAFSQPYLGLLFFGGGGLLVGMSASIISITTRSYRQRYVPSHLLARVMATVRFVTWGTLPFGALLAGGVAEMASIRFTFALVGVCAAVLALVYSASRVGRSRYLQGV